MKSIKIASPMFILRNECKENLLEVLEKLSNLGFDGVELLGLYDNEPIAIRDKLDELSLTAIGNHVDYTTFAAHTDETIAAHKLIGCDYITISGPDQQNIPNPSYMQKYLDDVIEIGKKCNDHKIRLLYHNHAYELKNKIDDVYLLDYILNHVSEEHLGFEADLGWIAIAGGNPLAYLKRYLTRCPVIHLKDFYADSIEGIGDISKLGDQRGGSDNANFEFRPTGYGIVNTPALLNHVNACEPDWLVVDHDLAYDRDTYQDLKLSLDFVKNLYDIHQ